MTGDLLSLRLLRETAGLTQHELGRRCGVTRASVLRWEAGTTRPSSKLIQRLSAALDVPVGLVLRALEQIEQDVG